MDTDKKRATLVKGLVQLMKAEAVQSIQEMKQDEPEEYKALVEEYMESTETTRKPTLRQLAEAEVDMLINSGDAMRDWLESFGNDISDAHYEEAQG